ncbi:hypothetical protein CRYUN_Cryun39dG0077100 [Craigia yunnanensis]
MELRTSDIEFMPRRVDRFTDINFKNGVLAIPPVTINDLFITILIKCLAFEKRSKRSSKDLTAYVSFTSSLIRHPTDVELLCSNGIISRFSHNDKKVADSFHLLCLNLSNLDIQDSFLSKTLMETERYYTRYRNGTTWCYWRHFLRYSRIVLFCITNFLFGFNRLRWGSLWVQILPPTGDDSEILLSTLTDDKQDIEVEYSPNKSEQSMGGSSGVSCSYETATVDKKVIKVDHNGNEIYKNNEDFMMRYIFGDNGLGMVIRDSHGCVQVSALLRLEKTESPLHVEIRAILMGMYKHK